MRCVCYVGVVAAKAQVAMDQPGSFRIPQKVKVTVVPVKREIIAIVPLPNYPGHWLLTGRTEGEFGTWNVVRNPNGTYWAAVMPNGSQQQPMLVELGDKVIDAGAVTQFESSFLKLQHTVNRAEVSPSPAELVQPSLRLAEVNE